MKPVEVRVTPHAPSWRWLSERVWSVEHAFERIKAEGRAEEDTRVRIFFVPSWSWPSGRPGRRCSRGAAPRPWVRSPPPSAPTSWTVTAC